ncbi:general odorant-binding protein 28a [Anabrus simplex]|uniref:general odorant-binding protein 28a n=1 Tax=Anabrus simplex TaxID=316456 RepID=UPI0034DCE8FC
MRQFLVYTIIAVTISVATAAMTREEIIAAVMKFRDECKKDFTISEEEEKAVLQKQVPTSQEGKCFLGCMGEKAGVIVNGQFDATQAKNKAQMILDDKPEKLSKAIAAIDKCAAEVTTTDKCETAPKLMECAVGAIPEFGSFEA